MERDALRSVQLFPAAEQQGETSRRTTVIAVRSPLEPERHSATVGRHNVTAAQLKLDVEPLTLIRGLYPGKDRNGWPRHLRFPR